SQQSVCEGCPSSVLRCLSRGRFSVVKRFEQQGTQLSVAAKLVNKRLVRRDQVTRELRLLQLVQHPQIPGLLDTFETPTSYVLLLEM
uniref:Protein kinase domain-containing protein n=1 Tax=Paramormyrops kingsleyae TaxID=1676925 RepID=A0A3B3QCS7_9TELE